MTQTIRFPAIPPSFNALLGLNPYALKNRRDAVKSWAGHLIKLAKLPAMKKVRLVYSFHLHHANHDCDNFCTKWITDSLARAGVIENDNMHMITSVTHQLGGIIPTDRPEYTILEIWENE